MSRLVLHEPHHDGSEQYLPEPPRALGDEVVVRLRVPRGTTLDHVVVRHVEDGEPRIAHAAVDEETETDTWWRASFRAVNPHTNYRFLLSGGDLGYAWLTGAGIVGYDVPDADDFVVAVGAGGPDWHLDSVFYEILRIALPRPGGRPTRPTGRCAATGTRRPTAAARSPGASCTAATSPAPRRTSTTWRRSAPTPCT